MIISNIFHVAIAVIIKIQILNHISLRTSDIKRSRNIKLIQKFILN